MPSTETYTGNHEEQVTDIRSRAEKVKQQLSDTGEKIKAKAEDSWDDLIETVKKHPGKALGVAVAAGVAIGTLITASSRRRSTSAGDQFRGLAGTGADAWDRIRSGFEDAVCTLKDAVDDAVKKFR